MHWARRAASRAAWTAGNSRAIRTAMMAMTTSSSIRVKPRWPDFFEMDHDELPEVKRQMKWTGKARGLGTWSGEPHRGLGKGPGKTMRSPRSPRRLESPVTLQLLLNLPSDRDSDRGENASFTRWTEIVPIRLGLCNGPLVVDDILLEPIELAEGLRRAGVSLTRPSATLSQEREDFCERREASLRVRQRSLIVLGMHISDRCFRDPPQSHQPGDALDR